MLNQEKIRRLVSKGSKHFEPMFKIYSPDENTLLTNDDGSIPFGNMIDVNTDNALALDSNWQNVSIAYKIILATSQPPNSKADYWVEINGGKERIDFGKYVQKHGFYDVYFQGN